METDGVSERITEDDANALQTPKLFGKNGQLALRDYQLEGLKWLKVRLFPSILLARPHSL